MDSPAVTAAQAAMAMRTKYGVSFNKNMDLSTLVQQWAQALSQNPQLATAYPAINSLMQPAQVAMQALKTANGIEKGFAMALKIIQTAVIELGAVTGYPPATPVNPAYTAAQTALITAQQIQQQAANAIQPLTQQLLNLLMN